MRSAARLSSFSSRRLRMRASTLLLTAVSFAAGAAPADGSAPGYYVQRIGDLRVTALFDGIVALPRAWLHDIDRDRADALLRGNYVPESPQGVQTAVNAYLVDDGRHQVLIDTGAANCFGDGLGHVLSHLRDAGYAPEDVDAVLLTHAHPDHLCGLLDPDGQPAWSNAEVWLAEEDAAYWLDPASESGASENLKPLFGMARRAAAPYQASGRLHGFSVDDRLPASITALPAHGHTPGHTAFVVDADDDQRLLVWGDIVHYHAVQFAQPEASFEADSDRTQAIATRRELLARAARTGWWVAGAHLPFPGLGHVGGETGHYRWIPVEYMPWPPK